MKLPNISPNLIGALVVWILSYAVYIFSAARTNPGYADSDEMITVGYGLGVAHPSGYPLLVTLIKLFTLMPINGSIAFKANLLSGFLHSLTVVFVYLIGIEVLRVLSSKKEVSEQKIIHKTVMVDKTAKESEVLPVLVAAGGSLLLAFSALFWLYSGVIEVFVVSDFLAVLAIWTGWQWRKTVLNQVRNSKREWAWFSVTCMLVGLGISHLHTFLFLLPGFGLLLLLTLLRVKKQRMYPWYSYVFLVLLVSAGFILPNLLLFWLNSHQANVSWHFPQDISSWWEHVTRRAYAGYYPERDVQSGAYIGFLDFSQYIRTFPYYWRYINDHFAYVGVSLGLAGVVWLFQKHKELLVILGSFFLFAGLLLGLYLGVPENTPNNLEYRMLTGVIQRQYLLGEVLWALLIIVGLWALVQVIKHYQKFDYHKTLLVVIGLVITLVTWSFWDNHTMGIQKNNRLAQVYAHEVLENADKDSVIICFSDFACFSLLYAQEVEGLRPDVAVVTKNAYIKKYYLDRNPELTGFNYSENPYFIADILTWNVDKRTTYLTDATSFYINYIGLEGNPFFLIPEGYLFKVTKKVPEIIGSFDYPVTKYLLSLPKSEKDFYLVGQQDYFANFHTLMAVIYSYLGLKDEARMNFQLALTLNNKYEVAQNLYGSLAGYAGNPQYALGMESSSSAYYLQAGIDRINQKKLDEAYKYVQKATFIDPLNHEARLQLANLYRLGGYYMEAKMEYRNVLKIKPDDAVAQKSIADILEKESNRP